MSDQAMDHEITTEYENQTGLSTNCEVGNAEDISTLAETGAGDPTDESFAPPVQDKWVRRLSNTIVAHITDSDVSVLATAAMMLFILAPGIMALMAMCMRSIDFTMVVYLRMIKNWIFPCACSMILVIYVTDILRIKLAGERLSDHIRKNPVWAIFAGAVFLMINSQLYNGLFYAIMGYSSAALGETFGMEVGYFVFILYGAAKISRESHKKLIFRSHIIVSLILVAVAFVLWNTQIESNFFYDWSPRFSSIFSNINYYGYYLAVSIPIAGAAFVCEEKKSWKAAALISFIINTIALSINDTFGSWFGAAFGVLFIAITHHILEKKANRQALVLIPIFILFLFIPGHVIGNFETNFSELFGDVSRIVNGDIDGSLGSGRMDILIESSKIVGENWTLGIGFEGVEYLEYEGAPYNTRPHNEFLQYALFHGVLMAVLYFAGCLGVFIRALLKKEKLSAATLVSLCGAFGYLVSSFFGITVFSTTVYLFIFLGMGYVRDAAEPVSEIV